MARHGNSKVVFLERTAHLANRVAVAGMAVVVVIVLALVAVVERVLMAGGSTTPPSGDIVLKIPVRSPRPPQVAPSRQRTPPTETLNQQVRTFTLAQRGAAARQIYGTRPSSPPVVGTTRFSRDRTWALGTTAIPAPADQPAMPQASMFVAQWAEGRWQMALAGAPEFTPLIRRAPAALVPAAEKRLLIRYSDADADSRSAEGLMLPWRPGDAWTITTATRGAGESVRPLGAVAFRGGNGRVLAAGDGRLYHLCTTAPGRGLVLVIHSNGLATQYYQMTKVTRVPNGGVIKQGDYLGRIGTDRPCGGAPPGRPEVRFAVRQGADDVPLNGLTIGGWTFQERAKPLLGWAERGVLQVLPGESLANFGPDDVAPPTEPAPSKSRRPAKGAKDKKLTQT